MQIFVMRPTRLAIVALVAILAATTALQAQVVSQSVSVSGEIGTGFYIGEFNSLDRGGTFNPSAGFDIGGGIKYQIASNFALMATIGYSRLSYVVDDNVRRAYGSNFFGPLSNRTYPGTTVELTKLNYIDYARYVLFGQSHFNLSSQLVPYFTLGLGMINFATTNGLGEDLPKNMTGDYSSQSLVMPLGVGLQLFLDPRLSVHGQALFYINASDYLDGYAHFVDYERTPGIPGPGEIATPPDYPLTFTVGASYAFHLPEQPYAPPIAATPPPEHPRQPEQPATRPQPEPEPRAESPERRPDALPQPPDTTALSNESDSDNDGLGDSSEVARYFTNPTEPDSDADGLTDYDELFKYNTSPNNPDTDRDALSDGGEVLVHNTDPLDPDSDDDLLVDGDEVNGTRTDALYAAGDASALTSEVLAVRQATDPLDPDTDNDGVPDGLDACPNTPGEVSLRGCPALAAADPVVEPAVEPAIEAPIDTLGEPEPEMEPEPDDEPGVPSNIDVEDAPYRADFEGITFRTNTDDFDFSRPTTQQDLARLLDLLNECEEMGVLIEGHTSGEGDAGWNQRLSAKRARRVQGWLAANGVSKRKLFGSVGYGSRMPKVAEVGSGTSLEELRSRNRRITALVRKPCP